LLPLKEVIVIIPTLNEVETIASQIESMLQIYPGIKILVIDDGSTDGTIESLNSLSNLTNDLIIIERGERLGLGSAYRDGFKLSYKNGFNYVIQMDGDGSHLVKDLDQLLKAPGEIDLVIGSRYVSGGKISGWKLIRRFISRVGNIFAKQMLRLKVNDATSGFKRLSRKVFSDSKLLDSNTNGYGFQIEIINFCKLHNFPALEVPITFVERRFGYSKFNKFIVLEALISVLKWTIKR